jgi:hypothetical protein
MQDNIQSFDKNNLRETLHPFVINHSHNEVNGHNRIVVTSDSLKHDNVAVLFFKANYGVSFW